jgi:hypothetical protein
MLFKVYHVQHKPIDLMDRDNFVTEWKERSGKLLEVKPASEDNVAWQAISDKLDEIELELKSKYKCEANWNIESLDELTKIVESYGTVSVCLEDGLPVLYIMDLPAQQKALNEPNRINE